MELRQPDQGRLPVFTDTIPDSLATNQEAELKQAVALASGVNSLDELDIPLYEVAKIAQEYLADAQNQPFVAVNVIRDITTRDIIRIDGVAGTLAADDTLVGLHTAEDNTLLPGIKTYGFSKFVMNDKRISVFGPANSSDIIPIKSNEFTLGGTITSTEHTYASNQEIMAGEDVVEWLNDNFEDPEERYRVFSAIVSSAFRTGISVPADADVACLADPTLTQMARDELSSVDRTKRIISGARNEIEQVTSTRPENDKGTERGRLKAALQGRAIDGIIALAELDIVIVGEHTSHAFTDVFQPNPDVSMAEILTNDTYAKLALLDYSIAPIRQLLNRLPVV